MPSGPGEPESGKTNYYEPDWETRIQFPDGRGGRHDFNVRGVKWSYRTTLGDSLEAQQQAILDWLGAAGCTVEAEVPGHVLAGIQKDDTEHLIYYFKISRDRTEVSVFLERRLTPDASIVMTIGGDGPVNIDFWVDHDGKKYQSLVVEFENEWVYFSGITRSQFGHYKRNVRHKSDCRIEHGSEQEIFDIPQYAGLYKWRVHSKSKMPQKVKVSLVHGPPLPALKDGPCLTSAVAHMIPVHAGRVTNLDWPRWISGRFAPQGVGRLEILDARHRETLGEVDVSLMELDADMVPKKDLLNCYEGGLAGKVISVEPLKTPLNLVLLLDSSGSMKKSMSQALESVKNFVGRFPEDAHITIVDFDTKPKILPSDSRAELLKSLDNVRPDGATALYDSILLGLEKLKSKDRRALVVFTDGVDANWDDTGPGSKATQAEVIKAVENAAIPGGGIGLFELWEHCPEGTQLAFIDNRNKRAFTDMLKEKGFQEPFVKHLNDCKDAILFPTNPAIINGEARWGWLEIDPKTYSVVSRLDNGAAGAMIEGIIGNLFQQATSYLVGALVGIDVSLWSVSLYSLQLEDYDAICEKAYGFAANFSKKFSVSEEITGPVGWDIGGSPDVELIKFDRAVKFSLDFKGIQASNNMLGFKNGYKDAVAYYFSD